MPAIRDYAKDKTDLKRFLTDFYTDLPDDSGKVFKYSKQLVRNFVNLNNNYLNF